MRLPFLSALAVLAAGLAPASGAWAAPVTLTFGTPGSYATYTEAGMTITPIAGSTAVNVAGGEFDLPCCNGGNYDFSFKTGGLFDFISIVFAHSDAGDPATFTGYLNGNQVAQQVVNGSNVGLVNFTGFTGLDEVRLHVGGSFRDPNMDNLTYAAVAVPAPGPTTLLLGALAFAGVLRRRRTAASEA